jgi:hypothetical protein
MMMRGSCQCGTVRYAITGTFATVGHCHCSMCRKAHGAAFATWGILGDPQQFRWTAGTESVERYPSSPGRERCFCRKCGSPLAATHDGEVSEVVLASLDDDPGVRPSTHIFVGSRAPWHDIADALPQHEEWPPGMKP